MKEQARFWFVHTRVNSETVNLAVAALTERSAKVQARKAIGPTGIVKEISPVNYAHAWVMNLGRSPKRNDPGVTT